MNITFELYFDFWWRTEFVGNKTSNTKTIKKIVKLIKNKFDIKNIKFTKIRKYQYHVNFDIIDNDNGFGLSSILDYLEKIEKKIDEKYIFDYYWKENENI